jgi:hypothetical protein
MKALIITPDDKVTIEEIDGYNGIKSKLDDGWLEVVRLTPTLVAYVDEEGKLKNLPHNECATIICSTFGKVPGDHIVGPCVVCGVKIGDDPEDGMVECDIPEYVEKAAQKFIENTGA